MSSSYNFQRIRQDRLDRTQVNADSLNVSGSANIVDIAVSGNETVSGNVIISGITTINNTTETTSKDTGAIVVEGGVGIEKSITVGKSIANLTGLVGPTITSKTTLPTNFNDRLTSNTHYVVTNGDAIFATTPDIVNSNIGDIIIMEYKVPITNSQVHNYGTSGGLFFMTGSSLYQKVAGGIVDTIDSSDGTTDNWLRLEGQTNGGPGIGTYIIFSYNGVTWRVECRCTTSGTGADAGTSSFGSSPGP